MASFASQKAARLSMAGQRVPERQGLPTSELTSKSTTAIVALLLLTAMSVPDVTTVQGQHGDSVMLDEEEEPNITGDLQQEPASPGMPRRGS